MDWLKTLGGGARGGLLRDDWKNERGGILVHSATFPRRPATMRPNDGIVYYAAGRRFIFAVGRITSDPYQAESYEHTNWPWRVHVSLQYDVDLISDGVPLEHLSIAGRDLTLSIKQHGYIA
jgi:hypothetical protein